MSNLEGIEKVNFNDYLKAEMMQVDKDQLLNLVDAVATLYEGFKQKGMPNDLAVSFTMAILTLSSTTLSAKDGA